jgi:hypothetical protein
MRTSTPSIRSEIELVALLRALELQLMDPAIRKDREQVSTLLADEFREFGSSGQVWSRVSILDLLASEEDYTVPVVKDFATQRIGPETALVTYRTISSKTSSLRSSIWVWRGERWQMLFHQGTRIPAE